MKINYQWRNVAERGQAATGYIDVYELINKPKAVAVIRYFPQFEDVQQRVLFTLILEGDRNYWTDGVISNIFEDAEARIFNAQHVKFNNFNKLDYMDYQTFIVKSIEDFDYLGHGDFTFPKPEKK